MALALTQRRRALAAAASLLAAMALAAAMAGRGCGVGTPGPQDTVQALIDAARAGDRQAVFDLLSPSTQQQLEERARAATDLVGSSVRYTALDLVSLSAPEDEPAAVTISVVERHDDRAVVEVVGTAGRGRIELVRIDGLWRIELGTHR